MLVGNKDDVHCPYNLNLNYYNNSDVTSRGNIRRKITGLNKKSVY